MSVDEVPIVAQLDQYIGEKLPLCKCGGNVLFIGNESPDSWIKRWKAWFLCYVCGTVFSQIRSEPLRILYSFKK